MYIFSYLLSLHYITCLWSSESSVCHKTYLYSSVLQRNGRMTQNETGWKSIILIFISVLCYLPNTTKPTLFPVTSPPNKHLYFTLTKSLSLIPFHAIRCNVMWWWWWLYKYIVVSFLSFLKSLKDSWVCTQLAFPSSSSRPCQGFSTNSSLATPSSYFAQQNLDFGQS